MARTHVRGYVIMHVEINQAARNKLGELCEWTAKHMALSKQLADSKLPVSGEGGSMDLAGERKSIDGIILALAVTIGEMVGRPNAQPRPMKCRLPSTPRPADAGPTLIELFAAKAGRAES